jgi:hypothetical protein
VFVRVHLSSKEVLRIHRHGLTSAGPLFGLLFYTHYMAKAGKKTKSHSKKWIEEEKGEQKSPPI